MKMKSKVSVLKRLSHYIKPHFSGFFIAFVALLVTAGTTLAIPAGLKYIVDQGLVNRNENLLDYGLMIFLCIVATLAMATFCRFYYMTWTGEKVVSEIRRDVYLHILKLSPEFYEKNRSGDILSRLTADIAVIQIVVSSSISVAMRHSLTLIGGTVMLFFTSAKLAIYVFAVVPVVVFPIIYLGRKVRALSKQNQERLSDMSAHIEENVSGIKTIQSYVSEANELNKFEVLNQSLLGTAKHRIFKRAMLTAIVIFLVFTAIVFVLWLGGKDVLEGNITSGELVSFLLYSVFVASGVGSISEVTAEFSRASGATERLFEILDTKPSVPEPSMPQALPNDEKIGVEFKNVDFAYPSTPDKLTLKNFSLKISPGEKIAIVGPSGAGKSTIFELLLRFYDIRSGEIDVAGVNIAQVKFNELRDVIGIVNQDPMIFSTTAKQNIQLGRLNAENDEIVEAAKAAASLEFIERLPDNFNTYLGEKGVRLSGGQKQRLAIARAILKNPKILLLDEATSALDSENERLIQQAIENLSKDRTTLIIAHRLSTIKSADRIVVLNEGQIEAIGTHAELMESSKLYKNLAELQFRV